MFLSEVSIRRPVLAWMMNLALVLFGLIGLSRLPVRELPDIDPPIVSVVTVYPGASAQVVETEVTERIEEAVNNIEGIKTLTSRSREATSSVTIEFDLSRDIEVAAQDVRDRVGRIRGSLPEDILEPIIAKQDADANAIMWIALNSDRQSPLELTTLAERQIKPRLQGVPGVSSIIVGGEKRYAMRLWLDPERMAARGVTVLDVQDALRAQNVELPSGSIENLDRELTIQTRGQLATAEEFNQLVLRAEGANLVRLRDVGRAEVGPEDFRTIARARGQPCIFLGIVKQAKANSVAVARAMRAEVEALQPTLPAGASMWVAFDASIFVEKAIIEVWETLAIAFGLVVLIVFAFLRNFRATLIPSVAIPVSIIGTFALMYWFGYSVNILTMLALVLAIGIVVDDAIVVLEAIYRHIEEGMPPLEAAFTAMREISFAVIAITISLVAVFTPLAFQSSTTGRLFIEFAVAVAGSVIISAFVALTLSPAMAARLLKPVAPRPPRGFFALFERGLDWLARHYATWLRWSLRHRWVVLLVTAATLGTMFAAYRSLEHDFLPQEDKGRMFGLVSAPNGATSEYTDRQVRKAEAIIASVPEVYSYGAMVAPAFGGTGQSSFGIVFVSFVDQGERKRSVQEIVNGPGGLQQRLFAGVEGALAIANLPKAIEVSFNASPFELILQNQDLAALERTANDLANRLRGLTNALGQPLLRNVQVSYEVNKPELRVGIERSRAASLGVSVADISRTMQVLFGGLDLSRISVEGKEYQVIAQLEREGRLTPSALDRIFVRSAEGRLIQLSSLVTRTEGAAPNAIDHYGRLRSASITGSPGGAAIGPIVREVEALLAEELPPGFLYAWGGDARNLADATNEIWWVLGLALIIVYMTLAAQFESFIHPFTVILSVPLAAVGAFGGLWLLDFGGRLGLYPPIPAMNINLFSQIGLVLLVGLVTKNAILLVEFANQAAAKGADSHAAMQEAGRIRLRPILMTACSTIAGIMPIAIGFGAGAESRRPMGIAVVGGMLTSTFLTLFVVPTVYTLVADLQARLGRRAQPAPAGLAEMPAK